MKYAGHLRTICLTCRCMKLKILSVVLFTCAAFFPGKMTTHVTLPGDHVPIRPLTGFRRIFIKRGEHKRVLFNITANAIAALDQFGNPQLRKGRLQLLLGGSQPHQATAGNKKTAEGILIL